MDLLKQTLDWLYLLRFARHVHVDHAHARDGYDHAHDALRHQHLE